MSFTLLYENRRLIYPANHNEVKTALKCDSVKQAFVTGWKRGSVQGRDIYICRIDNKGKALRDSLKKDSINFCKILNKLLKNLHIKNKYIYLHHYS
jgi:hypothetical protein